MQPEKSFHQVYSEVKFGADPELLVRNAEGVSIPAWQITQGTKENHVPIGGSKGLNIHADGVALEFNLNAQDSGHFHYEIEKSLTGIASYLNKNKLTYTICAEAGGFKPGTLMHPLALTSGCDPDFCAYDETIGKPRVVDLNLAELPIRYFGGHIHIGYDTAIIPPWALIRVMDAAWYLWAIKNDPQKSRRQVYGLAGLYRIKPYGVEYRTPSPFWLDALVGRTAHMSANMASFIALTATSPKKANNWFHEQPWESIRDAINNENTTACGKLFKEVKDSWYEALGIEFYAYD